MYNLEFSLDEVLAHHGVKGMKWGVRRDRGHEGEAATNKSITKLDKKFDKSFSSGLHSWIKVNNEFAGHINPMLDQLNSNPKYKDKDLTKDPKLMDAYYKDYEKSVAKAAEKTTASFGTNASGTRQLKVTRVGEGIDATWKAELVDVAHAATGLTSFMIVAKRNATGHIIGQTIKALPADSAQHSASASEVLKHLDARRSRKQTGQELLQEVLILHGDERVVK